MMISSEVQRTLVKSPPELWAELSDPAALARHLGELGEIRITRVEPEKLVEWEAEGTTGTVAIKASGWGTKVTLTVAQEIDEITPPIEATPVPDTTPPTEPEPPVASEPTSSEEPAAELKLSAEEDAEVVAPEPKVTVQTVAEELPESELRPGFFARLFRRRHKEQAPPQLSERSAIEPTSELDVEPEQLEAAKIDETANQLEQPQQENDACEDAPPEDTKPDDIPDIAAELKAAEEVATEQVTAVLTALLDRLGAAHHRPFSRS